MALKEAVTLAGKSLMGDKELLGDFAARGFLFANLTQIVHDTSQAQGNFFETDALTGDTYLGRKSETFLSSTAQKAPSLLNGGLTLYYGSKMKGLANSQTINWTKAAWNGAGRMFGSGATETVVADAAATTTTTAATSTTLAADSVLTGTATTTGTGVFAGETVIGGTTVAGEGIVTGTATTGGVFATEGAITSTVAADSVLTGSAATTTGSVFATNTAITATAGESIVTGTASTGSVFATEGAITAGETLTVAGEGGAALAAEGGGGALVAGGGGLGATVLSSVILPVAVAGAAYYTGKQAKKAADIMIATHDTYAEVDSAFVPGKRDARFQKPTPDVSNYRNIIPATAEVSKLIRDENLSHKPERLPDGRIVDMKQIDFTDPKNRAEIVRAINQAIAADQVTMDQNSSIAPRWLRSGDSVYKQEMARMDMRQLESAKIDLANYGTESDKYLAEKKQFDADQSAPATVTATATTTTTTATRPKSTAPKAG